MDKPLKRIQRRKEAINQLSELMSQSDHVVTIHYSCESFYDRTDGSSPRITSIAICNLGSRQTVSFSIHQIAEIKRILRDQIELNYDSLEKEMLDLFYDYVQAHTNHKWLHWNMRDVNYGFQAIAHRYKVLGGSPTYIHESNLFNLSRILIEIYGENYIGHRRLPKLVEKNKMAHKDFLEGEAEAAAFTNKDYVRLHQSTLRKVNILANIAERANNDSLETNANWKDIYGSYPDVVGEFLKENWIVSGISFISAIAGIAALLMSK